MLFRKLKYSLSVILREAISTVREIGLSWKYVGLILLSLSLITYLSVSIFRVISRGRQNYELIALETEKLNKLKGEGEVLSEESEYDRSLEFEENYARNSLNYARPNQELYFVKREEQIDYEYLQKNKDPIVLDMNKEWWVTLLFNY